MEKIATRLEGPVLVRPVVHGDERGFFHESYRRSLYSDLGIPEEFVQDNHSRSGHGIVRGMHFQLDAGASKVVRCGRGAILDVVVDIRRGSPTFGEWEGFELTDQNLHQIYIPGGFAHGFCVLSDYADVMYKTAHYYDERIERGISFADPDVAIGWPEELDLKASERDSNAPLLRDVQDELPFVYEGALART